MTRLPLSLPMARAFRAGLKTQTRRVSPPKFSVGDVVAIAEVYAAAKSSQEKKSR